jgi:hypothetical protein
MIPNIIFCKQNYYRSSKQQFIKSKAIIASTAPRTLADSKRFSRGIGARLYTTINNTLML